MNLLAAINWIMFSSRFQTCGICEKENNEVLGKTKVKVYLKTEALPKLDY